MEPSTRRYLIRFSVAMAAYCVLLPVALSAGRAVGAVLGAWLAGLIGVAVTISLGLIRWIFSVVAAMILINVYITATRR